VSAVTTTLAGQSSVQVSVVAPWTIVVAVEELLSVSGSGTAGGSLPVGCVLAALAVFEICVPSARPVITSYAVRKLAVSPRASVGMVQIVWPLLSPTLGKTQFVPVGAEIAANDENVVFSGMASVI
jgi:hypothetical protein